MTEFLDLLRLLTGYFSLPSFFLCLMLAAAWSMVHKAQSRPDFDFGNMMKDPEGKESAMRLAVLGAFCFSSWFLMAIMSNNPTGDHTNIYLIYLVCWSGSPVALKLGEALLAKWSK